MMYSYTYQVIENIYHFWYHLALLVWKIIGPTHLWTYNKNIQVLRSQWYKPIPTWYDTILFEGRTPTFPLKGSGGSCQCAKTDSQQRNVHSSATKWYLMDPLVSKTEVTHNFLIKSRRKDNRWSLSRHP